MSSPPVTYQVDSEPVGFEFNEKYLSQIPALQQLINLGYHYLTPEQALTERGGRSANVILEGVLRQQLKKINRINYKGGEYLFSEENIQTAIQKLKNIKFDGLQKTNETIYDLITLGSAMEQTIEGDSKSFTLNYIDWRSLAPGAASNNRFHVVAEFSVERARSTDIVRPNIVLFVNGIPFSVIECKSPKVGVDQAVSQNIRNQGYDYIPRLFTYVQQVLAVNKNAAQYATAGTPKKFWANWKEQGNNPTNVDNSVNTALAADTKTRLFSGQFAAARPFFDALEAEGKRLVTEQDNAIHSLCRPERLLDLVYRFTLFDGGIKKVARYQQYFVIKATIARIKRLTHKGNSSQENRQGGVIWHTQGSGKSLTMVMLTRAMALESQLINPRIILVTDRDNLDKQLGNTFAACGLSRERATSGRNLVKHLKNKVGLITTLIHKFDKGWIAEKFVDESHDIFVLVDESHRTNFGTLAARMRQMLPNACFLGFTGTPLLKEVKNSKDEEAYEVLLADDELREEFYECLSAYSKSLSIALSSEQFIMNSDEKKLQTYKHDLKRFQNLKAAVKLRYAEAIDYRDYEPKIKKLLDTHIQANEVTQLNEPVNIFDEKMFSAVKEQQGVYQTKTTASKADTIAHATKRSISENMDEDPAFYEKFSKLIQAAIDDFKAKRISDLEYLNRVIDIRNKVATKQHDDMPDCIRENDEACAYFGLIKPQFQQVATLNQVDDVQLDAIAAQTSLAIQKIIDDHWKVDFWDDFDIQKTVMNDIDDFLYDEVKEQYGVTLNLEQMDEIIEKTMQVAKSRTGHRRHS